MELWQSLCAQNLSILKCLLEALLLSLLLGAGVGAVDALRSKDGMILVMSKDTMSIQGMLMSVDMRTVCSCCHKPAVLL